MWRRWRFTDWATSKIHFLVFLQICPKKFDKKNKFIFFFWREREKKKSFFWHFLNNKNVLFCLKAHYSTQVVVKSVTTTATMPSKGTETPFPSLSFSLSLLTTQHFISFLFFISLHIYSSSSSVYLLCWVQYDMSDYLARYNNYNLPNSKQNLPNLVQYFFHILNLHLPIYLVFFFLCLGNGYLSFYSFFVLTLCLCFCVVQFSVFYFLHLSMAS